MPGCIGHSRLVVACIVVAAAFLTACHGVHPFFVSSYRHTTPVVEYDGPPFDREAFVQYLDTAAVDDWEGVWLLLGGKAYCYLAIERINNRAHEARYTHRLMLWFDMDVAGFYTYPAGMVMGYLEQELMTDVRRIVLYDVSFWNRWFAPEVATTAHMSDDHTRIMLENAPRRWKSKEQCGLKRIYPVRSHEERAYEVRYL